MDRFAGAAIGSHVGDVGGGSLRNPFHREREIGPDIETGDAGPEGRARGKDHVHDIGGIEAQPVGRQLCFVGAAFDPSTVERLGGDLLGRRRVQRKGQLYAGLVARMHGRQRQGCALFALRALLVVGLRVHVDDADPLGKLDLLRATLTPALACPLIQRQQKIRVDGRGGRSSPRPEPQGIVAFRSVEEIGLRKRLDRAPHGGLSPDDIAGDRRPEIGDVDIGQTKAGTGAKVGDDAGESLSTTTAAIEEEFRPALAAANQMRVGDGIVDLSAAFADGARPDLIENESARGGVQLDDARGPHQRPTLPAQPALTVVRPFVVDLDRNDRLPDDAGVAAPFQRIDRAW